MYRAPYTLQGHEDSNHIRMMVVLEPGNLGDDVYSVLPESVRNNITNVQTLEASNMQVSVAHVHAVYSAEINHIHIYVGSPPLSAS